MDIYSQVDTNVTIPAQKTNYLVGSGLLDNLHDIINKQGINYSSFLILADKKVFEIIGETIISSLQKLGKPIIISQIESSEYIKEIDQITKIVKPYFHIGFDRNACLISLGGGVANDIGGFIASILLRGIDSIYIPTTLLSQVDAAIGGKTGVNFVDKNMLYKNMLGSFYQPKLVISDTDTIKTLPEKELASGLGEVIKYWVGWGKPEINEISKIKNQKYKKILSKIIIECQKIKLEIIQKDPFETKGERQKLNLGHTIGHAIEGAANGKLSHGQAVSIGLAAAAKISLKMKIMNENIYKLIIRNITSLGLPTTATQIDIIDVLKALRLDKKGGSFVLIKDIGKLVTKVDVKSKIINKVLKEIIC